MAQPGDKSTLQAGGGGILVRDHGVPLENMIIQRRADGTPHHYHTPLENPRWVKADDDAHMRPDDAVLGVLQGGMACALPWWMMKNHHVANLELQGRPVMVVLCEACAGASAFDARVDGQRLRFRVDGKYNGTHILKDIDTGSHWTPFDGSAAHGPMKGARLEQLPLQQCTWAEWKEMYPRTVVPDGAGESRTGHGSHFPTPSTLGPIPFAMITALHKDERLKDQVLVLGVKAGEAERAYPLRRLHRSGLALNDRLGDYEIVVFSKAGSWMAIAFERVMDGRTLHFDAVAGLTQFEDAETGSRWDINGRAIAGPLSGRSLGYVPSGIEKWYGWATSHPGTDIFQVPAPPAPPPA